MELLELLSKLDQIEEQARLTLEELPSEEFPKHVGKERQRIIIALVKHVRREVERTGAVPMRHAELLAKSLPT
jgi:hypothetical protein